MGLFGRSSKQTRPIRDWATGPIERQSKLATEAPDVLAFALDAIAEAGRTEQADPAKVLVALDNVLGGQMDAFAERLPGVDVQQFAHMRDVLRQRPDFRYEMYFDGLTYFGASGIAMSNGLSEQLGNFHEALLKSLAEGTFDRG